MAIDDIYEQFRINEMDGAWHLDQYLNKELDDIKDQYSDTDTVFHMISSEANPSLSYIAHLAESIVQLSLGSSNCEPVPTFSNKDLIKISSWSYLDWQKLANYLYINDLILHCKGAAIRISPQVWDNIEKKMLTLDTQ